MACRPTGGLYFFLGAQSTVQAQKVRLISHLSRLGGTKIEVGRIFICAVAFAKLFRNE